MREATSCKVTKLSSVSYLMPHLIVKPLSSLSRQSEEVDLKNQMIKRTGFGWDDIIESLMTQDGRVIKSDSAVGGSVTTMSSCNTSSQTEDARNCIFLQLPIMNLDMIVPSSIVIPETSDFWIQVMYTDILWKQIMHTDIFFVQG